MQVSTLTSVSIDHDCFGRCIVEGEGGDSHNRRADSGLLRVRSSQIVP
jgi:hypothetical protein